MHTTDMKCKIFFTDFDSDSINTYGWEGEEGKLYLKLVNPLSKQKSIDALDEAIDKGKYRFVDNLEIEKPEYSWSILQNVDEGHHLNDRSMHIGDVVICDDIIGKIVELIGWSDLSEAQIEKFRTEW